MTKHLARATILVVLAATAIAWSKPISAQPIAPKVRIKDGNLPGASSGDLIERAADGQQPSATSTNLGGTSWQLVKFQGRDGKPLVPDDGSKYTIAFGTDGRLSVRLDCNRGGGTWKSDGKSQLQFSQIALTLMACLDSLSGPVGKDLSSVRSYVISGGHLFLSLPANAARYEFEPMATAVQQAPSGLRGTSWRLVKIQSSDNRTFVPDDKGKYTINFGTDGRVNARIDCNRGSGNWLSVGPNQLRFGPLVITRAMCPPGSLHDRIVKDWAAVRSYVIKDGHLFLSLMADGGIYEFEPSGGSQSTPESITNKPQAARVSGTITYLQRSALLPSAIVEVKLVDVSLADAPARTIAEEIIRPAGRQVPFKFDLSYDPSRIDERGTYAIQVRILEGDKLRFTNTDAYLVITGGHPNMVDVIVKPVRQ